MSSFVTAHENRLTLLDRAAVQLVALKYCSRKLNNSKIPVEIIASYGCFPGVLASMHRVVAMERCALEKHVFIVEEHIMTSTHVLVSTVGSLLRKSALREVGAEAGALGFAFGDEGTRALKFDMDMVLASYSRIVDANTRLGLVGDPCQLQASVRTLPCVSSLDASCGLSSSAVTWILDRVLADDPTPYEFVASVDLFNRYTPTYRCRALACRAANKVAPLWLPGEANVFGKLPSTKKVWEDLRVNTSLTPL